MDLIRRKILATGAAATAMAAVRRVFGQRTGKGVGAMSFYEKGPVRIHYEETGSGFPLLLIATPSVFDCSVQRSCFLIDGRHARLTPTQRAI